MTLTDALIKDETVIDKEKHYRCLNDELKQKTERLLKEANAIMNLEKNTEKYMVTDQPRQLSENCVEEESIDSNPPICNKLTDNNEELYNSVLGPVGKLNGEAKIRYLVAKVRSLEEDNEKLNHALNLTNQEVTTLTTRLKEVEIDCGKFQRQVTTHSTKLERFKQSIEEASSRADLLCTEKTALERELEASKRKYDQYSAEQKTATLRLNRALEKSDRQRFELEANRAEAQVSIDSLHKENENLIAENKRLDRQKQELVAGFKKQMRLIDVLRRQKMLVEASKALKITEDDFLKSLDLKQK